MSLSKTIPAFLIVLVLALTGCAGMQRKALEAVGKQGQAVVIPPPMTQMMREMLADQISCQPEESAVIVGGKDTSDKITLFIRCE